MNESERSKAGDTMEAGAVKGEIAGRADGEFAGVRRCAQILGVEEDGAALESFVAALMWAVDEARNLPFDEVEAEIVERRGPEILRRLLQANVDRRGNGDIGRALKVVETEGVESTAGPLLSHRREGQRTITTSVGPVIVRRQMYGQRGEESIVPLDEAMNLPSRSFSHVLTCKIVTQAARAPYEETARTLEEMTGRHVSVASMLGLVGKAAVDFDDFYVKREGVSFDCELLVATIDGKGIPIRREADADARKRKRLRKGEKANRKAMACVAVVYEVEPYHRSVDEILGSTGVGRGPRLVLTRRPRPQGKRAWASLEKNKDEMFEQVREEMLRRDPGHRKVWVCVTDGDPALDRRAVALLGATGPVVVVRDIFHVVEYLWNSGHAFHAEGSDEAKQFVAHYLGELLDGRASQVARGLRQSATKQCLRGTRRKAVDDACRYILNNKHAMRYDEYLERGLPIRSGVVEGACRHLEKDRMERAGMRWTVEGAEAVLKMRAIEICGDTNDYWRFHRERERHRLYGSRRWEPLREVA